jgi:3-phenylpropionate/trans-cinnamate dioxygenase ferredoxin component
MLTDFVKVAQVAQLPEGTMLGIEAEGEDVCLARIGGEFFAINNICSHQYTWLDSGDLIASSYEVRCPLHDSRFSFKTGAPTTPPADKPVQTYAVRIQGDDILVGPKA